MWGEKGVFSVTLWNDEDCALDFASALKEETIVIPLDKGRFIVAQPPTRVQRFLYNAGRSRCRMMNLKIRQNLGFFAPLGRQNKCIQVKFRVLAKTMGLL